MLVNHDGIQELSGRDLNYSDGRLLPGPRIRILNKLLQSPAWSWNKRQWIKPNNFQPLLWIYIFYYLSRNYQTYSSKSLMFNLSSRHPARQHRREGGHRCGLTACNSTNCSGSTATSDLLPGRPEAEAHRQACAVTRVTFWNVEKIWKILMSDFIAEQKVEISFVLLHAVTASL